MPTITIALCGFLPFFRVRFVQTRNVAWEEACCDWTKVFALTFALGAVSGIVVSFQFGTNWPGFMERTDNISGPLLGAMKNSPRFSWKPEAAATVAPPSIALSLITHLVVYGLLLVNHVGMLKHMAEHPKDHAPGAPRGAVIGWRSRCG